MLDRFSKLTGERDNVQKTAIAGLDETIRNNTWICPIKTDSIGKAYWNSKANIIKVPDKGRISDRMCLSIVHWYMR